MIERYSSIEIVNPSDNNNYPVLLSTIFTIGLDLIQPYFFI